MKGVVLFNAGILVQSPQRFRADPHALFAAVLVQDRYIDQVRLPLALHMALRVRHFMPRLRPFPR